MCLSADIRVDWQMFNLPPTSTNDDISDESHPLNFIVSYAESFPLLDENGIEIIPPYEDGKIMDDTELSVSNVINKLFSVIYVILMTERIHHKLLLFMVLIAIVSNCYSLYTAVLIFRFSMFYRPSLH